MFRPLTIPISRDEAGGEEREMTWKQERIARKMLLTALPIFLIGGVVIRYLTGNLHYVDPLSMENVISAGSLAMFVFIVGTLGMFSNKNFTRGYVVSIWLFYCIGGITFGIISQKYHWGLNPDRNIVQGICIAMMATASVISGWMGASIRRRLTPAKAEQLTREIQPLRLLRDQSDMTDRRRKLRSIQKYTGLADIADLGSFIETYSGNAHIPGVLMSELEKVFGDSSLAGGGKKKM